MTQNDKKPKNELKTFREIREYLEKRGAEMFEIKHTDTGFSITGLTKDGKELPKGLVEPQKPCLTCYNMVVHDEMFFCCHCGRDLREDSE